MPKISRITVLLVKLAFLLAEKLVRTRRSQPIQRCGRTAVTEMYNDFYRFKEDPFNITPDPHYWFLTSRHQDALNHLLFGIQERKGFIQLTGEVGAGKTTLCRVLLNELPERFHTALILNPVLTETQLIRAALAEFGISTKRIDKLTGLSLLNEFLLKVSAAGQDAVLIIDEAQDMPDKTLEMARLLSNLETERQKLLQIALIGQPELRKKLQKTKFRQLAQRITIRYHLRRLSLDETTRYIQHRLHIAAQHQNAASVVRFDADAVKEIHHYSGGTPRLVNAAADKALLAGYVNNTWWIDKRLARRAIKELKEAA